MASTCPPLLLCHRLAEKIRIAKMNRDRSVQMQEKVQQQQQQKDYDKALHKYVDEVGMGMGSRGWEGGTGALERLEAFARLCGRGGDEDARHGLMGCTGRGLGRCSCGNK